MNEERRDFLRRSLRVLGHVSAAGAGVTFLLGEAMAYLSVSRSDYGIPHGPPMNTEDREAIDDWVWRSQARREWVTSEMRRNRVGRMLRVGFGNLWMLAIPVPFYCLAHYLKLPAGPASHDD